MKTAELKRYFIVGDKLLCFIPRTASTSLLKLIEDKHYPQMKNQNIDPHFRIPSIIADGKSELVAMFRNPVDRFLSGCAQKGWTIEEGIAELNKTSIDIHIRPQYTYLSDNRPTKLFRFPDQLKDCVSYLELPAETIPHLNKKEIKPIPTESETEWLTNFYSRDFELFNAIE